MQQETKITRTRIRNHWTYGWWKYALMAVAVIFGWNLIYTSSAYKAPKDKRLDIYFVTQTMADEASDMIERKAMEVIPELEDANCLSIYYTESDNYYGNIQLTTYIGAQEGDIYVLERDRFEAYAASGAFAPLEGWIEDGTIRLAGCDTAAGTVEVEDDGTHIAGIPAASLYGMMEKLGLDNRNLYLCVAVYGQNQENAAKFLDWFIEDMTAPKPEWLEALEAEDAKVNVEGGVSTMPSY